MRSRHEHVPDFDRRAGGEAQAPHRPLARDAEQGAASLPNLQLLQPLGQRGLMRTFWSRQVIPYSTLLSTLSLASVPELEDLLIELFYGNVLTGRLDQKGSRLEVLSSVGRDVRPAPASSSDDASMQVDSSPSTSTASAPSISSLTASLTSWLETISSLLSSLDKHIAALQASAINASQEQLEHEKRVRAVAEEVMASSGKKEKGKGAGASSGGGGEGSAWRSPAGLGDMDVDSGLPGGLFGGVSGGGSGLMRGMPPLSPGGGGLSGGGNSGGRTRKRGRM